MQTQLENNKTKSMMKKVMGTALSGALIFGMPVMAVSQAAQAATAADNLTAAKRLNTL